MNTSINISWINKSNTYIFVQLMDKRDQDVGFNSSKLDLSWVVDSYRNDTIKINLTFDNLQEISPNIQ